MSEPADRWSLRYVGDPMCSWCYGFAPSIDALRERHPTLEIRLLMGGLRVPGAPLDARLRAMVGQHWDEVERRSGQPFERAALQREGWLYTTEPACRAVVTVRALAPARALPMFDAVQRAFYRQVLDTTDAATLAGIAASVGVDREAFAAAFDGAAQRAATAADFDAARAAGVHGFPTLLAERGGREQRLLAAGWLPPAALLARVDALAVA